jgi:glycine/D-amino acid oxidase-like deaminating enzyme
METIFLVKKETFLDKIDVDAVVIGAGFFGIEIALELRRLGLRRVMIVEREGAIMRRASAVNQARVHNGYHYPRSLPTAERSRAHFEAFVADYGAAVLTGMRHVYAVAAGSRVSPAQFEVFCRVIGAPCRVAPAAIAGLFDRRAVQAAFMVRELAFDFSVLATRLRRALADAGIMLALNAKAQVLGGGAAHVDVAAGARRVRARHVVNCTYADIDAAGVAVRSAVRRELAELVLLAPPPELAGLGVTVMDGPFFSTMPYPGAPGGLHSLSHVRYTPHGAVEATPAAPVRSHRDAMLRDGQRYLPCLARSRVVGSLFEVKATLARHEGDDGRPVLMERSAAMPRVLSVLGAKIDNIYEVRRFLRTQDWQMAA